MIMLSFMQGFGLTDISLLTSYPHIQRLTLASNNLTGTNALMDNTQIPKYLKLYVNRRPLPESIFI